MEDYITPQVWVLSLMSENPICTNSDKTVFEDPFLKDPFEW